MHGGLMEDRIPIAGPSISQRRLITPPTRRRMDGTPAQGNIRAASRKLLPSISAETRGEFAFVHFGLHLALAAAGIGPGDEVIVPDLTWIASAAPVAYVGATPVFADVDERTWCLSAESVCACLTENTKAILPVDLYGGVPDYDALRAIAEARAVDCGGCRRGDWQ